MPDYDFAGLSDFEFEDLVKDLCQKQFGVLVQTYERGRDGGIDCRYLRPMREFPARKPTKGEKRPLVKQSNALIVQCKHYRKSGFAKLYSDIERNEVGKIQKLSPEKYVLATSVGLTPMQEDRLLALITPFCTSVEVWGRLKINSLLGLSPEIEQAHFKLWLTSTPVLQRLLNGRIFNQTDFELEEIRTKLSRYVHSKAFGRAKQILDEHRYCIVAGIPGIGKTTLAQVLASSYMDDDFQIISASAGVDDAISAFVPERKQLFLVDDFLGQNILEMRLERNEDQRLLLFIRNVCRSPSKRMVLTTREYILNYARTRSELLHNSLLDLNKVTITIDDFRLRHKAKILYNHLFFSEVPDEYLRSLVKDQAYRRIVHHPNFSPRVIEWMTDPLNVRQIPSEEYANRFIMNLRSPNLLWEHVFDNQLTDSARAMLLLLSLVKNGQILLQDLETAFLHYMRCHFATEQEISFRKNFQHALKIMDGNFILTRQENSDNIVVTFHNPSVRDFIFSRLREDKTQLVELINSVPYFEMLEFIWHFKDQNTNPNAGSIDLGLDLPQFIDRLRETLFSPTCDFSGTAGTTKALPAVLKRLLFLLKLSERLSNNVELNEVVKRMAPFLKGELDKWDIESLVHLTERTVHINFETKELILRAAFESLIGHFRTFEELWGVLNFIDSSSLYEEFGPGESPKEIFLRVHKNLCVVDDNEDLDFLREEIRIFQKIAAEFAHDITDLLDQLSERLAELEEEFEEEPWYDEDYRKDEYRSSDDYISVNELSDMFDSFGQN